MGRGAVEDAFPPADVLERLAAGLDGSGARHHNQTDFTVAGFIDYGLTRRKKLDKDAIQTVPTVGYKGGWDVQTNQ